MTRSRTPVSRRRGAISPPQRHSSSASPTIRAVTPLVQKQASPALPKSSRVSHHVFSDAASAPTLLDMLWNSIATPGAGPGLIAAVNGSLCMFLTALGYFSAVGDWEGVGFHMSVLCFLAIGLLLSFNMFILMVSGPLAGKKR